ncbi:hypothetical protein CYY_001646 [Polysphondylium violaceum]|uniref:Uncharacterized protein n=1 Tax=Polysphondylium violaceum TaxID=133409 RepID=A0A8J4Q1E8_9MYCE|nr:hypothetical protein CYY_001646 [Polysphondylium violaceum]
MNFIFLLSLLSLSTLVLKINCQEYLQQQPQQDNINANDYSKKIALTVLAINGIIEMNNGDIKKIYTISEWATSLNGAGVSLYSAYTNTSYFYNTRISNKTSELVKINNTIDDFTDLAGPVTTQFGNDSVVMNPYSFKYSLSLSKYQFTGQGNNSVVIKLSAIDVPNLSNSTYQFIKLKVIDNYIYGKLVIKAIIDGVSTPINNIPLDSDNKIIENNSSLRKKTVWYWDRYSNLYHICSIRYFDYR